MEYTFPNDFLIQTQNSRNIATDDLETLAITTVENTVKMYQYDAQSQLSEDSSDFTPLACDARNVSGSLYGFVSCVRVL